MPTPLWAVIGPNVRISVVVNPYSTPAHVVEAVIPGKVVAVVTRHLLDELTAVLKRPKSRRWLTSADVAGFAETFGGYADLYPDPGPTAQRVRDPDDDLVALAEDLLTRIR